MKTFSLVALLSLTIAVMVLIIDQNESASDKLITVDTFYSFISDTRSEGIFRFYLSDHEHPLAEKNSYQHVFITNDDGSKRIEIELKDIEIGHSETYLNDIYWRADLSFDIPAVDHDFMIERCFIDMTLIDQSAVRFYLGSVHFLKVEHNDRTLDWSGLYGMKAQNDFLSRIESIHLELNEHIDVLDAKYGVDRYAAIEEKDEAIVLRIPREEQLLYNVPVILRYVQNSVDHVTIIDNFTYVIDYEILSESGPLIHVYALD